MGVVDGAEKGQNEQNVGIFKEVLLLRAASGNARLMKSIQKGRRFGIFSHEDGDVTRFNGGSIILSLLSDQARDLGGKTFLV